MREFAKYIIAFGIVSSIFDFVTFYILYGVFHLKEQSFQTGWFIESIATQVLVIFIIRTKRVPFFKSMPSIFVGASAVVVVIISWLIPYTPIGPLLSFTVLSPILLTMIGVIVVVYLVVAETTKYFFYRAFPRAP